MITADKVDQQIRFKGKQNDQQIRDALDAAAAAVDLLGAYARNHSDPASANGILVLEGFVRSAIKFAKMEVNTILGTAEEPKHTRLEDAATYYWAYDWSKAVKFLKTSVTLTPEAMTELNRAVTEKKPSKAK